VKPSVARSNSGRTEISGLASLTEVVPDLVKPPEMLRKGGGFRSLHVGRDVAARLLHFERGAFLFISSAFNAARWYV
jgi:hypothetical protein